MRRQPFELKYAQQHLANERTFLAWLRTAITIIGLGFLAAGVVFRTATFQSLGHLIAAIAGIGSVMIGGMIIVLAALDFRRRQRGINSDTFQPSGVIIWLAVGGLAVICTLLLSLVVILLYS